MYFCIFSSFSLPPSPPYLSLSQRQWYLQCHGSSPPCWCVCGHQLFSSARSCRKRSVAQRGAAPVAGVVSAAQFSSSILVRSCVRGTFACIGSFRRCAHNENINNCVCACASSISMHMFVFHVLTCACSNAQYVAARAS